MRSALVALPALVLALVGPAAQAETWSAHDRRADVRAVQIQLDSSARAVTRRDEDCDGPRPHRVRQDARRDVLGLAVDHGPDVVTITLTMRKVARRDTNTSYSLHLRTPRRGFDIGVYPPRRQGPADVFIAEEPDYPDPEDIEGCAFAVTSVGVPCEALAADVDPRHDQVTVTLPRTCLRRPDWVRAAAEVHGSTGRAASGRFTLLYDTWARHGAVRHGFLPPFGPRVRSS